jgi:SAM-dependent methyltransferase
MSELTSGFTSLGKQWLASVMECDLVDFGQSIGGSRARIFMPEDEVGKVPPGVTAQFLADADTYHQKYYNTDHSEWLLRNALAYVGGLSPNPVILDVGSGSGSSVISMLNVLERPTIVASDISPTLLQKLQSILNAHPKGDLVSNVCLDLNKPRFKKDKFDLAIGSAILHHLFDPEIIVSNVYQAVKPGGSLIFFEPFELGYDVLSLLFEMILEASHRMPGLEPAVRQFLERSIENVQVCEPKPEAEYVDIDDKWTFTRSYFERMAERLGASLTIYPLYDTGAAFTGEIDTLLRLGLGADKAALPDWAWAIVNRWEKRISADAKRELFFAGGVVLTKR